MFFLCRPPRNLKSDLAYTTKIKLFGRSSNYDSYLLMDVVAPENITLLNDHHVIWHAKHQSLDFDNIKYLKLF